MGDALQRIVYDVTIDDCTDVAIRLASRTKAFRNQFIGTVALGGALAGTLVHRRPASVRSAVDGPRRPAALGDGSRGRHCLRVHLPSRLLSEGDTQTAPKGRRRAIRRQRNAALRDRTAIRGGWCRVGDIEMVFPWKICTSIQNAGDIEINFLQGIRVVRDRRFVSPADRQEFLETARRLSAQRN